MVCKNPRCFVLTAIGVLVVCVTVTLVVVFTRSADTIPAQPPPASRATDTLQLVFVISRHGNRCPVEPFPNYPYSVNDTNLWPYGKGHLTRRGLAQMRRLGAAVREMYSGFLDTLYQPEALSAASSPVPRTLMSAEAFLSGLYPPTGPQLWDPALPWQPVPVYPSQILNNEVIVNHTSTVCPAFTMELNQQLSLMNQNYEVQMNNIFHLVQPYSGPLKTADSQSLLYFWDSLKMTERESLPLPTWTSNVYPEPLDSIVNEICMKTAAGTDTMIRLFGGPIFQQIMKAMNDKVNTHLSPNAIMYYFSGHEVTIAVLKAILGLPPVCPDTGSALVIELHRDLHTLNHFIQVVYIDGKLSDLEPIPLDLPQCPHPCSLDTLMDFTNKYYNIEDYNKECHV